MRSTWSMDNYFSTGSIGAARPGLPVGVGGLFKQFTVGSDTYQLDAPGAAPLDLEELVAQLIVTAETGTSPTVDFSLEECGDPLSSRTQINQSAGLAANGTSLVVDDATDIPNSVFPIMLASFTLVNDVYRLSKYEWCISSGKSGNTLTLVRGVYMAGKAFSDDDFVFFSNNWTTMKDNAGNDIKNAAVAIDGASTSAPVKSRLALSSEGLEGLAKKFFRTNVTAPTNGNATYRVELSGRTRGLVCA